MRPAPGPRPPEVRRLLAELDRAQAEVDRVRTQMDQRLAAAEVRATSAEARITDALYSAAKQRSELMQKVQQAMQAVADTDRLREEQVQRSENNELRRVRAEREVAQLTTHLRAAEQRRADLADQVHRIQVELANLRAKDAERQAETERLVAAAEERAAAAEARAQEAEAMLRAAAATLTGVQVRVRSRTVEPGVAPV
ncbi:MAG: hypothetical protein ACTHMS_05595 [Jatrophihabitans sp.]|uniref:hypothetical protein n=1 Tax=Jatrophihabitans sp. TaxID=1932789 RepID=UPI003F7DD215